MPTRTETFASPEAHVAANTNADLHISLLLRKTRAPWMISSVDLPDLRAQWGLGGGCTVTEGTVSPGGRVLFMPTENVQAMHMNGRRFDAQTFRLQRPGDELSLSSNEPHGWFSMFIADRVFGEWSRSGAMPVPPSSCFLQIPQQRAEAFRRTVVQLGSIVRGAPGAFDSPLAIATTSRRLTELAREVFGYLATPTTQTGRHILSREQIVSAVMDCIDRRDGEYLTVPDLASAAGVSERTLRAAFQDYFGVGPVRFLRVRTLNLARLALKKSDPALTTVTEVATRLGVWELGRFARDYRLLFGELPSATLYGAG